MKWPFLIFALAAIYPLKEWLRRDPTRSRVTWTIVGILPFVLTAVPHTLFIAIVSWAEWPGLVKGIEITALDILGLAIFLSQPRLRYSPPFKFSSASYFLAVVLSAFWAGVPIAALFYAWQLLRIFLVYWITSQACTEQHNVNSLLKGMAIGLSLQAAVVIWQRFALGEVQTAGTFAHQNTLGLMSNLVVLPSLALLLAGDKRLQPLVTCVAGIVIAILTASRATLGLLAFGFLLLFVLSAARKWSSRKAMIALASAVIVIAISPFIISTFEARFAENPLSDEYDERAAFKAAAGMMLSDHPMGIGANNFVVTANTQNYYDRAGVLAFGGSRGAPVHNVYWLAAAETGYLGVVTLVLLLLRPLIAALRTSWSNRKDLRGDLQLGLGVALLTSYIHSAFEFVLFSFPPQYLLAIIAGLIVGLARQLGYWYRPALVYDTIPNGFIGKAGT